MSEDLFQKLLIASSHHIFSGSHILNDMLEQTIVLQLEPAKHNALNN
jgi:hypothetical protein